MAGNRKTTLLCVLDGLGLNPESDGNAVFHARTPTLDKLYEEYPYSTLTTFGQRVGLPEGQMGNSEVGHLNIGAGRVVEQWLQLIRREFREGRVRSKAAFQSFLQNIQEDGAIHLVGLYSSGGVHSHRDHLTSLIETLRETFTGQIVLHPITDGRDTSPNAARKDLAELVELIEGDAAIQIGSVSGRFYTMDRDSRWERIEKGYRAVFEGEGEQVEDPVEYCQKSYENETTDEFLVPVTVDPRPLTEKDGVLFFNFRADRMRQIVRALSDPDFDQFERRAPVPSREKILTFAEYDKRFHLPFLFELPDIKNHLGEVISNHGLTQLRTAETEKYPHVTYFLNGGVEGELKGETRAVLPSPRDVKTYDEKPEMSAFEVTEVVLDSIRDGAHDLIVVNFANCDMVGHTGDFDAAVKAVETVDHCLGRILEALQKSSGQALIIADHGNAEQMKDYGTGGPHTSHTTYPVPVILFGRNDVNALRNDGALCDVAPTILELMEMKPPAEMTGESLLSTEEKN